MNVMWLCDVKWKHALSSPLFTKVLQKLQLMCKPYFRDGINIPVFQYADVTGLADLIQGNLGCKCRK